MPKLQSFQIFLDWAKTLVVRLRQVMFSCGKFHLGSVRDTIALVRFDSGQHRSVAWCSVIGAVVIKVVLVSVERLK